MPFSTVPHRRLLLVLAASVVTLIALAPFRASAESGSESPIVSAALARLGTHGGQCWTFMREMVAHATGHQVGFDYRQGFFEAGAVEVSADEATAGDIIQIASDANTSPWASYPGLHTAIIMKNLGGGRFDAIDSNQNWDEMVNLRPNYDPYTSAARNGLQVHIYRIPGGGPGAMPASAASSSLAAGDTVVVHADPGCLNLRDGAGLGAGKIACLATSTSGTVVDGPASADGYTWVKIDTGAGTGWAAALYLVRTGSAAPPPPSAAIPASVQAATAPAAQLHVDNSPGCLRLRTSAGLAGAIVDCLGAGTALELLDGNAQSANGYDWIRVRAGSNEGWVAKQFTVS